MFGSLPVHARSGNAPFASVAAAQGKPWRTLLIRPQPGHPGEVNPPDYLIMDLFWMPVVDPYAISEPLSTAGKVNLNYQIQPFTYIRRATGLIGLLRSERITAVQPGAASVYKTGAGAMATRFGINVHETLKQFDRKFASGELFLTEAQLASIHLVPAGQSLNADGSNADAVLSSYWNSRRLTGDNVRERPYTNLIARATARSNTFTIHYRVEALKKRIGSPPDIWSEGQDLVTASQRGSTTIERYVNPQDSAIPDYASLSVPIAPAHSLPNFYRWRILAEQQFNP
jgi:uncharacterized protein (TIGR02600 family)